MDVTEPMEPLPVPTLPPPNGFGSLEDTNLNCTALVPRAPKLDFYKLMNKDKIVLRFRCRFAPIGDKPLSAVDKCVPPPVHPTRLWRELASERTAWGL